MSYIMGGQDADRVHAQAANSATETPAQRAQREDPAAADARPCGGFIIGGNGYMLASGVE